MVLFKPADRGQALGKLPVKQAQGRPQGYMISDWKRRQVPYFDFLCFTPASVSVEVG